MKKMIIAVVAIAMGLIVNAATYNWSAGCDWFSDTNGDDAVGTVYVFDGSAFSASTILSALAGGDLTQLDNALDHQDLEYGAFLLTGTGITDNGEDPAYAQMFAVVMNEDNSGYWASDVVQVKISKTIEGGQPAGFAFGEQEVAFTAITAGGPGTGGEVPEPTSGLLLVLGVAGLALKRKRA